MQSWFIHNSQVSTVIFVDKVDSHEGTFPKMLMFELNLHLGESDW